MKTWIGSSLSLILLMITYTYAANKLHVWYHKADSQIMEAVSRDFFFQDQQQQIINKSDGMKFAVAFTSYSDNLEPELDKSIGEIVFSSF